MLKNFEQLEQEVRSGERRTVAVACGDDPRTLRALELGREKGLFHYLTVGKRSHILQAAGQAALPVSDAWMVEADGEQEAAEKAVALVREGRANFLMKGNLHTATLLKEVVKRENGLRGAELMSHVAMLQIPSLRKLFCVTDGGMVPQPDLAAKAEILQNALCLFRRLGYPCPKAACLSASETAQGQIPGAEDALRLVEWQKEGRFGLCMVDGPLSFDLAVSRKACVRKQFHSPSAGDADILLAPDMTAGNILSKALVFGGGQMAGCVLGAKVPIALVSRAASAYEKYHSLLLASAASAGQKNEASSRL